MFHVVKCDSCHCIFAVCCRLDSTYKCQEKCLILQRGTVQGLSVGYLWEILRSLKSIHLLGFTREKAVITCFSQGNNEKKKLHLVLPCECDALCVWMCPVESWAALNQWEFQSHSWLSWSDLFEISMDYKEHFTYPGEKLQVFSLIGGGGLWYLHVPFKKSYRVVNFHLMNNTLKKYLSHSM